MNLIIFLIFYFKKKKIHLKKLVSFSSILEAQIYLFIDLIGKILMRKYLLMKRMENRHPYEITIEGYVNKLLINGQNIKIDRNKNIKKFLEVYFQYHLDTIEFLLLPMIDMEIEVDLS